MNMDNTTESVSDSGSNKSASWEAITSSDSDSNTSSSWVFVDSTKTSKNKFALNSAVSSVPEVCISDNDTDTDGISVISESEDIVENFSVPDLGEAIVEDDEILNKHSENDEDVNTPSENDYIPDFKINPTLANDSFNIISLPLYILSSGLVVAAALLALYFNVDAEIDIKSQNSGLDLNPVKHRENLQTDYAKPDNNIEYCMGKYKDEVHIGKCVQSYQEGEVVEMELVEDESTLAAEEQYQFQPIESNIDVYIEEKIIREDLSTFRSKNVKQKKRKNPVNSNIIMEQNNYVQQYQEDIANRKEKRSKKSKGKKCSKLKEGKGFIEGENRVIHYSVPNINYKSRGKQKNINVDQDKRILTKSGKNKNKLDHFEKDVKAIKRIKKKLKAKERYLNKKQQYLIEKELYLFKKERQLHQINKNLAQHQDVPMGPEEHTKFSSNKKFKYIKTNHRNLYVPIKEKQNKTIAGDWYRRLYAARQQIRKREHASDWLFDRANMRNRKRDKAQWYFQWMTDREHFRFKRHYRPYLS